MQILNMGFSSGGIAKPLTTRTLKLGLVSLIFSPALFAGQDWPDGKVVDSPTDSVAIPPVKEGLDWTQYSQSFDGQLINHDEPLLLAAAETVGDDGQASTDERSDGSNSEQCAAFAADIDADLGAVLQAGCQPTLPQMSALMDNPIGNVAMMFNQFDYYNMKDPVSGTEEVQGNYMALFQFPKKLNNDWNLINRVIINVPSVPLDQDKIDDFKTEYGTGTGNNPLPPGDGSALPVDVFSGRTEGFGDMYYVGLFAPNEPMELDNGAKFLWGAGFDLSVPTANEDMFGTGKYSAGPSALGVYMGEKLKAGALVQHYWDYAGDSDRADVNMTNIQLLYYYSLSDTVSIGAGPNIIANWEQDNDNTWTVPVGIGINKTFQFGNVPVRIGLEYYHTVIEPYDVVYNESSWRLYIIPSAPSALFSWMQ